MEQLVGKDKYFIGFTELLLYCIRFALEDLNLEAYSQMDYQEEHYSSITFNIPKIFNDEIDEFCKFLMVDKSQFVRVCFRLYYFRKYLKRLLIIENFTKSKGLNTSNNIT
jgi:hypothetical protein